MNTHRHTHTHTHLGTVEFSNFILNRYLKYTLDQYVESDYTVVYFHYGLRSSNKPSMRWLGDAYKEFDRKCV